MRSVRLGEGGGDALYTIMGTLGPSLAIMTGRDKLRQDMAGLGRTGQGISSLSAPLGYVLTVLVDISRHPQQVTRPQIPPCPSPLSKSLRWEREVKI